LSETINSQRPSQRLPVDPRFRRRWVEARRAEGRHRLRILLACLGAIVIAAGLVALAHSPVLSVRDVVVEGNAHTPRAEIVAAAGLSGPHGGALMIDAGSAKARRAVEALPWVSTVTFERRWPWTVVIKVKERSPVADVLSAAGTDVVDVTGRVLEVISGHERPPVLPVVSGARPAPLGGTVAPGSGSGDGALVDELAAAAAVPEGLSGQGLVLSCSPQLGLVAHVGAASATVVLGDASEIRYKLAVLDELVSRLRLSAYSQVDLTAPERPALTPVWN